MGLLVLGVCLWRCICACGCVRGGYAALFLKRSIAVTMLPSQCLPHHHHLRAHPETHIHTCIGHNLKPPPHPTHAHAAGEGPARGFCSSNFLSPSTMFMIDGMRGQLASELTHRRLISSVGEASSNARHVGLVRCVLVRACRRVS